MIVIDTNVISEFTRPTTSDRVSNWFRRQSTGDLYTTAITEAELSVAYAVMPSGRRRDELARATEILLKTFGDRVLPFDRAAAREFSGIVVERRAAGRNTKEADGLIAAIVKANGALIATRNVDDFTHCGLTIINPWTD
jgi:toxin FitB